MDFMEYDTRLAAYAVVTDDHDRVLLALWNEGPEPLWTLTGGGVELEETVEQAAVRELREETGYDVRLGRLLGVDSELIPVERRLVQTTRPLRNVRVLFEGTVVGGDLRCETDGTTDEARWIPVADVESLPRTPVVDVALGYVSGQR